MANRRVDYSLYLVTDQALMRARGVEETLEQALQGGCTLAQIREKTADSREFYQSALRIKQIADRHGVPLVVNDRVDIALAVDAAGVHVGQSDLPAPAARKLIGPDKILGVSASTFDEAMAAAAQGADYLGVGAMFATDTKSEARLVSLDELRRIRAAVSIPIVVIGGIGPATLPRFRGIGIDGIAVVSAILARPDIETAAKELRDAFAALDVEPHTI